MARKENLILQEGMVLARGKWKKYITGLTEGYKRKNPGREVPANILATAAMMLENTSQAMQRMDETTKVVNLGNFVDYGFGVITAVMPALVANQIVSVQPLKARTGEIFYMDYKYASNKGTIKAGDTMISAFTGPNGDTTYTGESVAGEELALLKAGESAVEGNLAYYPVKPGTVDINAGSLMIKDDGAGHLFSETGSGISDGVIKYETGEISFKLTTAATDEMSIAAGYSFSFGNMDIGGHIPAADIDLRSTTISTVGRSLRSRWLFDVGYELQQVHGLSAEEEISNMMAAEVRHEIDAEIMNDLWTLGKAGGRTFTWKKTAPTGVSYVDHKDSFVDTIIEMSNAIFADTLRADGNFIIAGVDAASILEAIPGRFVPNKDAIKAGPHVVGRLDNRWDVVKDPFYGPRDFVVGYKGASYLEGGYVYAPYLPLMTTPTAMLDDFVNRKGCRTVYGKKMLNSCFYAKGKVID